MSSNQNARCFGYSLWTKGNLHRAQSKRSAQGSVYCSYSEVISALYLQVVAELIDYDPLVFHFDMIAFLSHWNPVIDLPKDYMGAGKLSLRDSTSSRSA